MKGGVSIESPFFISIFLKSIAIKLDSNSMVMSNVLTNRLFSIRKLNEGVDR